jgi:hypothetical protein
MNSSHAISDSRLIRSLLAVAPLLFATETALAASGADGGFGYTWRDAAEGAIYDAVTPDPFQTANPANNGPIIGPVDLMMPNGFTFYGRNYTQVWIADNGWISFVAPAGNDSTPSPIPDPDGPSPMLAPFWTDLDCSSTTRDLMFYGPVPAVQGYMVSWGCLDSGGVQALRANLVLFPDGRIKFHYSSAAAIGAGVTIGIEAAPPPTDGIEIAAGGMVAPGVDITARYVIEFLPPPILPSECSSIPVNPCSTFNASLPASLPANILYYCGAGARYEAREAIHAFTLTQASTVDIRLTAGATTRFFLVGGCSERNCLRGPTTTTAIKLGAGTYHVIVDAPLQADEGPYTLAMTCTPLGASITCPTTVSGTTAGGTNSWTTYPCAPGVMLNGPETFYTLDLPALANVRATLDMPSANLDVLVLRPDYGEVTPSDCVAHGANGVVAWNAAPGEVVLAFDGVAGVSGSFSSTVTCDIALDCSSLAGSIDFGTGRVQEITGDSTTGANNVEVYNCNSGVLYDGPEVVYEVTLTQRGQIALYQVSGAAGLTFFFASDCNEGACVGFAGASSCATQLDPGTYYLIIDGENGAGGPFELQVMYEDIFNRWDVCELPQDPTMVTDTSSPYWHFSDGAFCIENPQSRNYPDGCTWAMYATVACGTSLHLPLYDCEGGHVRVFDIFRGEYVQLTALSQSGWFMQSDDIRWQDADCDGGSDPNWNEVVTDISFERPEGLCGVFRIEFPLNHSGFVWELYANCTGQQAPLFNIHDTLCTALADYTPLPNISLVSASAVSNCPQVDVTYTLRNDGCQDAIDFESSLLDDGAVVAVDVAPVVPAGQTITRTFSATFTPPTGFVTLELDTQNLTTECTEGSNIACGVQSGNELQELPGCAGVCIIVAQGTASPPRICAGSSTTIDGSTSSSSLCPGGILQYQLRGPGTFIPWQDSPTFTGISPAATGDFTLEVRCADPALRDTCVDTQRVSVEVDLPPAFPAAPVQALDIAPCNLGVQISWDFATWFGLARTGYYNIYRSEVSCADAVARTPLIVGLPDTQTSYTDVSTVGGRSYYYVVEAEDGTPGTVCSPRGPRNNGAVTRVDCNGGTCVLVTDNESAQPDLLPRVRTTLRAGGTDPGSGSPRYAEVYNYLEWQSDRPPSALAGEHFHVMRSDRPDSAFGRINEETPPLRNTFYDDFDADDPAGNTTLWHVWYYLLFTADACENDNSTVDSYRSRP